MWGQLAFPNRDALLLTCDSSPVAGVRASRTVAGSSPKRLPGRNQLCALLDQRIGSPGILIWDVARDRKNLSILFQSAAADDAIGNWEILRRGECIHEKFGDQSAAQNQHLLREP